MGKSEAEKEKAEKQFRDVGEAHEVLSDPTKKQVSAYICDKLLSLLSVIFLLGGGDTC